MSNVRQLQPKTHGKEPVPYDVYKRDQNAIFAAIAQLLDEERETTRKEQAELDGRSALLGAGREVGKANLDSIVRAIQPTTERRAVIVEGVAPQWAAEVFK